MNMPSIYTPWLIFFGFLFFGIAVNRLAKRRKGL